MEFRTPKSARVIQVVQTVALRGDGTAKNPVREVVQYWDFGGNLLAENDTKCLTKIKEVKNNE